MGNGRISVIIPCYNVENLVGECIDSIVSQTIGLDRLEIILVDDASTDGTAGVLKEYEKRFPENIMVILCDINGRQGTARNIGLEYASGEYISFVDSDDFIQRDMYRVLVGIIDESGSDIVQFRYQMARDISDMKDAYVVPDYKLYNYAKNRRECLLSSEIMNESCTTKLYRSALIDRAGVRYAEKVAYEEPLFTYPLKFYADKVAVIEYAPYYYRMNPKGTMLNYMNNPSTITDYLTVWQLVYTFMKKTGYMDTYKDEIDIYFIIQFYSAVFSFFKKRGFSVPVALLRYMAKTVCSYVPDYSKNPYLSDASLAWVRDSLKLMDKVNLPDEQLEAETAEYMKMLEI